MKTLYNLLIITCLVSNLSAQEFFFNPNPDFETLAAGKIATGLGIADINKDGWKDLIVANGNDIERQKLEVYLNKGDGSFNNFPDWESDDIDYHGHLAVGDLNNDGYVDVAVSVYIGIDGFDSPGKLKVYFNNSGELEKTPSFESEPLYTFSCSIGDTDADGDLDIAVACGDSYNNHKNHARIFINNGGSFETIAQWRSEEQLGAMDCKFADFDQNGFLDVVFACDQNPSKIFLADNNGIIDTIADWQSSEEINANSLDVNFVNNDNYPDLIISNNNQLSGSDGKNRLWTFSSDIPETSVASWTASTSKQYRSGILMLDYNQNDTMDLIHGGWWQKAVFQNGNGIDFDQAIEFQTSASSVVEAIVASDLDKGSWITENYEYMIENERATTVSIPTKRNIEDIVAVYRNDLILYSGYIYIPGEKWISFEDELSEAERVKITYKASLSPDLVITNWDSGKGNFIYYNQKPVETVTKDRFVNNLKLYPNPATNEIIIEADAKISVIEIYACNGQLIKTSIANFTTNILNISNLETGIYWIKIANNKTAETRKIIKL